MDKQQLLFSAFIRQHQARLRAYIRGLGVKAEAVDDLAQESFLLAYKELDRFDQQLDFGHWLFGIARNLVRNELRKQQRQQRIMDESLSHFLISEFESSYEPSDQAGDELEALRACVALLPEKSQRLLSQKYQEEHSSDKLAGIFMMSATAVRLALMRLRKKLRSCMETRLANV